MRNIAMILTYEGTAYHGWQVQKNAISVCETMERAAAMVMGHKVKITGCGRTDAGVHARNYVANFRTDSRIPVDRIPYAMNTHLPHDIVVREAFEVPDEFNAIGSCVKKEYTYQIYNSRIRDPFYVNRACFYPKHLDETVMNSISAPNSFAPIRASLHMASLLPPFVPAEIPRTFMVVPPSSFHPEIRQGAGGQPRSPISRFLR